MLDLVLRDARLEGGSDLVDIAIVGDRIVHIGRERGEARAIEELGGALVIPGLVETHIHLDKACLLDRCAANGGTLPSAIAEVARLKRGFTTDDIYVRGRRALEMAILQGTNRIRTHVEVDPRVGLRGFDAIRRLKQDYAFALDLQICVFPQEGLTNDPGTDALLVDALSQGADLLGGCPYTDSEPNAQIAWLFATAKRFDVDLDLHLDFDLDASWMSLNEVIRQTRAHRFEGRVTVGHVTKLSMLHRVALDQLAGALADADIAVTALPSTDLFLMGREVDGGRPRGVAPLHELRARGVRCSISTNNILNPFTPFGDASLIRQANLFAIIAQIGDMDGIARCLDLVCHDAAGILGAADHAIVEGGLATLVVLDAPSCAMAIATIAQPLFGIKDGRRTFARARAEVFHP